MLNIVLQIESSGYQQKKQMKKTVQSEKSKSQPKKSSYTVSFPASVWALTVRQFQIKFGDIKSLQIKTATNIIVALVVRYERIVSCTTRC